MANWYFMGTRFIDTGYNDPASWASSYDITELYQARAYYAGGTISNDGVSNGTKVGNFKIVATPMWGTDAYKGVAPPGAANNNRVFIKLDFYLTDVHASILAATFKVTSVVWGLYRA